MVNALHSTPVKQAWRYFLGLWSLLLPMAAATQISVVSVDAEVLGVTVGSFPGFTLSVIGGSAAVVAEAIIAQDGRTVLTMRTGAIRASAGINTYPSGSLSVVTFRAAPDARGQRVMQDMRLPGGSYECCLTVTSDDGELVSSPFCEEVKVQDDLWIDLVEPWDGDTIDDTRPMLAWTPYGVPRLPDGVQARLVLAPSTDGQKSHAAVAGTPVFIVDNVTTTAVPYPAGAPDLQRGRCYAWQVEAWKNNVLVTRTEPWRFCVRANQVLVPEKYVLLRQDGGKGAYQVVDGFIYFRTDERYATKDITCAILAANGERVEPEVIRENAGEKASGARSVGVNLYELDLMPYRLKQGNYRLEVLEPNGVRFALQFNYIK
jgi:hypothetical protein